MKTAVALTIAGSDSGGEAGIQADLKTFQKLGVHGTNVITCLTAQNPSRVKLIEEVRSRMILCQLEAIFEYFNVIALKIGMITNISQIKIIKSFINKLNQKPFILWDPIVQSSSGKIFLKNTILEECKNYLFPIIDLITPNLDEFYIFTKKKIENSKKIESGAHFFFEKYKVPILLKGGHLKNTKIAKDVYYNGNQIVTITKEYFPGKKIHGSGCIYSAAIVGNLVIGNNLITSIKKSKNIIHNLFKNL